MSLHESWRNARTFTRQSNFSFDYILINKNVEERKIWAYIPESYRELISIRWASSISQHLSRSIDNYLVHLEHTDSCLHLKIWTFEDYCLGKKMWEVSSRNKRNLFDNALYSLLGHMFLKLPSATPSLRACASPVTRLTCTIFSLLLNQWPDPWASIPTTVAMLWPKKYTIINIAYFVIWKLPTSNLSPAITKDISYFW